MGLHDFLHFQPYLCRGPGAIRIAQLVNSGNTVLSCVIGKIAQSRTRLHCCRTVMRRRSAEHDQVKQ